MRRSDGEKEMMKKDIRHLMDLEVYLSAFDAAMKIFEITKSFR